ncbi:ribonuclease R [Dolosigranulum pigrum]|uniref:ribonuclease R n=1 Tax=Dolosigranulum pigrum TaxID=29394 RepID=UPI001AD8867B|nr:ribonuclease R [Dolosigranulum pigrum]QTJ42933.1 ribonuclease R [Dolosigranulum pigrum]QTJ46336.1 ribonuclease R [Dolosigranulum pigrum]QTJ59854.1 ribonuclease R [Dolosigranulum pigrum]
MSKDFEQFKQAIIDYIEQDNRESIEVNDVTNKFNNHDSAQFKRQVKALAALEREEKIEMLGDGRLRLKRLPDSLVGTFSGTDRGFGFVMVEDEGIDDIFVPAKATKLAFDGDTVEVEITEAPDPSGGRSAEGKITRIIERKTEQVIGEFIPYTDDEIADYNLYGYVKAKLKKGPEHIIQIEMNGLNPTRGEIVSVDITHYPAYKGEDMRGIVTETIGHKDEPGIEILSIVHKHNIRSEFPDEVLAEAEQVPDQISAADLKGRRDLRGQQIITIDGADAKDLDDAVTVERLDNGHFQLGVHIADVSHYVREDSALDKEAFERGTSSYLTDRVIPMLPQRLSNGICSLHPKVDRLTLSCEMEINQQGNVVAYDIFPSVIRSVERMTYEAVNHILEEKHPQTRKQYQSLVPMLEEMAELHHILEQKRRHRGAIDFDSDEAKIIVDKDGKAIDIELRERRVGERLIESFMLAANETVSEHYSKADLPILYRVHEQPDESKMKRFLEFITTFGLTAQASKDSITPKDLQGVMDRIKDEPYEAVISMLLLRSMQQARYDVDPIGHYGLGADYYSHFTSPIRRYPDLILHRLIHYYDEVGRSQQDKKRWASRLPDMAKHSSEAERRAIDAERETDELKKTEFMADKVGQEFMGTIISITGFGMFIQLPNTVEGLVHVSMMDDDYYRFDEDHLVMIGERTGKVFRIGQPIKVKLMRADVEEVQIDFSIVEDFAKGDKPKDKHHKKIHRQKQHHKSKLSQSKHHQNKPVSKQHKKSKKKKKKSQKNRRHDFKIVQKDKE